MFEMLKRERWNRLAEIEMFLLGVGSMLGVKDGAQELVTGLKKLAESRLNHEYYDAGNILDHLHRKLGQLYKDRNTMERLKSMSA